MKKMQFFTLVRFSPSLSLTLTMDTNHAYNYVQKGGDPRTDALLRAENGRGATVYYCCALVYRL